MKTSYLIYRINSEDLIKQLKQLAAENRADSEAYVNGAKYILSKARRRNVISGSPNIDMDEISVFQMIQHARNYYSYQLKSYSMISFISGAKKMAEMVNNNQIDQSLLINN